MGPLTGLAIVLQHVILILYTPIQSSSYRRVVPFKARRAPPMSGIVGLGLKRAEGKEYIMHPCFLRAKD